MSRHKTGFNGLAHLESYSAIIPTFNGLSRGFIDEAIQSVLLQSHPVKELIVVDDGSTDDTVSYLRNLYPSVILVESKNAGPALARNLGLKICTGKYVAFLDDDDIWLPDKMEQQLKFLSQPNNIGCGMAVCAFNRIDKNSNFIAVEIPPPAFFRTPIMYFMNAVGTSSTVVVESHLLKQIGGFDESLRFGEDYECWLRVASISSICSLEVPLANIRRHESRASTNVLSMYESVVNILDRQSAASSIPKQKTLLTYVSFDYFFGALYKRKLMDAIRIFGKAQQKLRIDIFFCLFLMWIFRKTPRVKNFFRLTSVKLALGNSYR